MRRLGSRLVGCVAAACAATMLGGCGSSSPAAPTPTPQPTTPLPTLQEMLAEKVLGDAAAPVTMIEYSSLTCSYCGDFHVGTLPVLKANYIDTGKVRLVYRDYPPNAPAMAASMIARCSGSRFFTTIGVLYQSQSSWTSASNSTAALKGAVASMGITSDDVDACLAVSDLKAGIQANFNAYKANGVNGTPTFVINGQTIVGAQPYSVFDALLKSLLGP
jgi:protein-disulfide isomerase